MESKPVMAEIPSPIATTFEKRLIADKLSTIVAEELTSHLSQGINRCSIKTESKSATNSSSSNNKSEIVKLDETGFELNSSINWNSGISPQSNEQENNQSILTVTSQSATKSIVASESKNPGIYSEEFAISNSDKAIEERGKERKQVTESFERIRPPSIGPLREAFERQQVASLNSRTEEAEKEARDSSWGSGERVRGISEPPSGNDGDKFETSDEKDFQDGGREEVVQKESEPDYLSKYICLYLK